MVLCDLFAERDHTFCAAKLQKIFDMCKYFFIFFDFSFFSDRTPTENFHALRTQIYALYARFCPSYAHDHT